MSLRLEMLQVARLAPKALGASADLVREFLRGQQNSDGGFKDRTGRSDLYYTVFGLEGLLALQAEFPVAQVQNFLRAAGEDAGLDFVHLCCLGRCWAALPVLPPEEARRALLRRIEQYRSKDGGYHPTAGSEFGTAYGCFLALGAYQDLKGDPPVPLRMVQCLKWLETRDGAWSNERISKVGSTNATAAAATLLRHLALPINPLVGDWLLARFHPQGGFVAAPDAPLPDLLSTATVLHALSGMQRDFGGLTERCLDFIDSLWTNQGTFHGHWGDELTDCEYTYYGLLALGHLSL